MNISIQKQIDLIKKAIINAVTHDSTEDAEECATDVAIEYLNLLQNELKDLKPVTVEELLKKING